MSQVNKFQNIVDWVKSNIDGGIWKPGDRIPSENELSAKFGVSRQTVRRALDILAGEKLIQKSQGSGTFVRGADLFPAGTSVQGTVQNRTVHNNIAVVCTFVDNYIFPGILKGMESVISASGYALQLSFTNDSIYREKTILENIIERNDIDGLIVEPAKSAILNPNLALYEKIEAMGIPILFFHAKYPDLSCPVVGMDDEQVGADATRLLLNAGHRKLAGIFHSEDEQGMKRYAGFIHELWNHNLSPDDTIWLDADMIKNMDKLEDYIFESISGVTGVVCYNDEVAYKLITMAQQRGIRVPEELSVVGIDDSYLAVLSGVQITSFRHPHEELGVKTGENMLKMLKERSFDANYTFDSKPVIRDSISMNSAE